MEEEKIVFQIQENITESWHKRQESEEVQVSSEIAILKSWSGAAEATSTSTKERAEFEKAITVQERKNK